MRSHPLLPALGDWPCNLDHQHISFGAVSLTSGLTAALLAIAMVACSFAQTSSATPGAAPSSAAEGILQAVHNARLIPAGDTLQLIRDRHDAPAELLFAPANAIGVDRENDQWWILPISAATSQISANTHLWILPLLANSADRSWQIELHGGTGTVVRSETGLRVRLNADIVTLHRAGARPHSDAFGNTFSFELAGGRGLEDALAGFYWGTMLPSVVEKTMAAGFRYSSGYVLSTLKTSSYAGSYPAVDHEFQIKGRLAFGSEADLDIVRRMIELQLQLMADDPERLSRAPTSVQPDGSREYHIRRNSMDRKRNAAMFPVTGNIEILEEAWLLYEARKDLPWLRSHITRLESAAAWTEASIDQYGRLWSDVYYEDQVIKDGRETQAQAFAAYTFDLLSRMERVLGRQTASARYATLSRRLADALIKPTPEGFWDEHNQRFIDWIDRDSNVHDHVHLLANTLPVTFGYATPAQTRAVLRLVQSNAEQFERFPTFLAADIAAYTQSEIGDGGPYDLSAAGRYWFWDAAFRQSRDENDLLLAQLNAVAAEAAKNNFFMGERYDMDHVYYIDGKNAHGAEQYYEYPNVFTAVLISQVLGISVPSDADLSVAPHLTGYGNVELHIPIYAVRYHYSEEGFVLTNLSDHRRHLRVDLSGLSVGERRVHLTGPAAKTAGGSAVILELQPHTSATWTAHP